MGRVVQDVENVWRFDNASRRQEKYREQWDVPAALADRVFHLRLAARLAGCSADVGASAQAASDSALTNEAGGSAHAHARNLKENARREALASSTRLSEVSTLQQTGFTDADARLVQFEEE
eukprot:6210322-Pleurochrysis_carterae.AAC.1